MRRRAPLRAGLGLLAVAASLAVAGYALAADAGISLTSEGPDPATVSINWGDTVTFTNRNGLEHVVAIPGLGYTSPAIAPGSALEYTFTGRAGNFRFVQRGGPRTFSGQVRVSATGSVTLRAGAEVIPFGQRVTLSGRSTFPGTPVVVMARPTGGGALAPVLETTAGADGSYSGSLRVERGARLQARVAAGQIASPTISVRVRPRVVIRVPRRVAAAGAAIAVTGTITPSESADRAELAAFDSDRKRWVVSQTRSLPKSGRVAFRFKLDEGRQRIRILVRRTNAGFATADSRIVSVLGTKKT
jgi:plastocyanin